MLSVPLSPALARSPEIVRKLIQIGALFSARASPLTFPPGRKYREDDGAGAAKCRAIGREMIGISASECFCA